MNQEAKVQIWKNRKFGMFIHYGLYSIPGGVWKGEPVTHGYSEQIYSHGPVDPSEYEALTEEFTAAEFNPREIVSLAKQAGMTYLVIGTKHHDGFCLFRTDTTDYNSYKAAAGRDLIGELADACRAADLGFGLYFSWIDWNHPSALPVSDHNSDAIPEAHMELNRRQITELCSNYGPICEIWFDMGAPTEEQSREMASLVRRLQPGAMINGRIWNGQEDFLVMGDNEIPSFGMNCPWQTPASIYHETWGYRSWQVRDDLEGKIREQIRNLARISARGGNFLLNIGPKGDGSIVSFEAEVLRGIGQWIEVHRAAVFSVEPNPWEIFSWGECTCREKTLFAFLFSPPADGKILLPHLETCPVRITLMGAGDLVEWQLDKDGLVMYLPDGAGDGPLDVVKLEFPKEPVIRNAAVLLPDGGLLPPGCQSRSYYGKEYYSYRSFISGETLRLEKRKDGDIEFYWELPEPAAEDLELSLDCGGPAGLFSISAGETRGPAVRISDWKAGEERNTILSLRKGSGIPEGLRLGVRR